MLDPAKVCRRNSFPSLRITLNSLRLFILFTSNLFSCPLSGFSSRLVAYSTPSPLWCSASGLFVLQGIRSPCRRFAAGYVYNLFFREMYKLPGRLTVGFRLPTCAVVQGVLTLLVLHQCRFHTVQVGRGPFLTSVNTL